MKSKLIVRNFGPIVDATLNLRNVNVLIGAQASGKSTLTKLYTICKSPSCYHIYLGDSKQGENVKQKNVLSEQVFVQKLSHYSIADFIQKDSYIFFDCPTHSFEYKLGKIEFVNKLNDLDLKFQVSNSEFVLKLKQILQKTESFVVDMFFELYMNSTLSPSKFDHASFLKFYRTYDLNTISDNEKKIIIKVFEEFKRNIFYNDALYVPAERTILNMLKEASFSLQMYKIPIPQHLIAYGHLYENATAKIKELDLGFISKGTKFKYENGQSRIYFSQKQSIKITDSASGFQSIIPILLPILNAKNEAGRQYSFVIEEPETNLYPKAQYELLKFLEKTRDDDFNRMDRGSIHTYTTHSPFILTALNNMLYAYKKGKGANNTVQKEISKIVPTENWINPELFSAYEIKNGKAKLIFDRKTGLIKKNSIDKISERIIEDFRSIALSSIRNV